MYINNPFEKEVIKTISNDSINRANAILEYKQSTLSLEPMVSGKAGTALFGLDNYISYNNGVNKHV